MLAGKRILLIIGGGIAAYKALELIRRLLEAGAGVTPVLTRAGQEFVTPLSVAALAGAKAYTDLFDLTDEAEMGHIQLSRAADLLVVAPATADLMAKMAGGHANDLASTLLMATDKRVLIAPAMNVRMWQHPATQRNLAALRADGVLTVGPDEGDMACGEYGPGRMAEVPAIMAAIAAALGDGPLKGRRILVTSGPTEEPIDPVRYIANRSSGAQGTALAAALAALGAEVAFVTGPASVPPPQGVAGKIKKDGSGRPPVLELAENPDILARVAAMKAGRPRLVVGFAAETDDVLAHARAKRARKGCDWIVANDVSPATGIMGGAENAVTLITAEGEEAWPRMTKAEVARRLAARIAEALA